MDKLIKDEMASLNATSINWKEVKSILNGILVALNGVLALLPSGLMRNILSGVISALSLVISMIPSS